MEFLSNITSSTEWHNDCELFLQCCEYGKVEDLEKLSRKYEYDMSLHDDLITYYRNYDTFQKTAVHWATYFGNMKIIRFLSQEFGVDFAIEDTVGYSVLHWKAMGMHNKDEMTHYFVNIYCCDVEQATRAGRSAIIWAARNENFSVARFLLDEGGANVYVRDVDNLCALDYAILRKYSTMVTLLETRY